LLQSEFRFVPVTFEDLYVFRTLLEIRVMRLCSIFEKLPWKKDEKLFDEATELLTKRQYENWVIYRFGIELAETEDIDLVFRPPKEYPDAILIQRISEEDIKTLNVEFEEYSSDFKAHDHDPEKCDLIVCGYHDWKEKFPNEKCPLPVYVVGERNIVEKLFQKE